MLRTQDEKHVREIAREEISRAIKPHVVAFFSSVEGMNAVAMAMQTLERVAMEGGVVIERDGTETAIPAIADMLGGESVQTWECPTCGHVNEVGHPRCVKCGAHVPEAVGEPPEAVDTTANAEETPAEIPEQGEDAPEPDPEQ